MKNRLSRIGTFVLCLGAATFIGGSNLTAYAAVPNLDILNSGYGVAAPLQVSTGVPLIQEKNQNTSREPELDDNVVIDEATQEELEAALLGEEGDPAAEGEGTEEGDAEAQDGEQGQAIGVQPGAPQNDSQTGMSSGAAYIEVKGYTIEGGLLEAGKDLTVKLTLHNISTVASAENLILTMSSDSGMIYPKYGTDNQFFVGSIQADESKVITIPISISSKLDGDSADFRCTMDYKSAGESKSNSSTMVITKSSGKNMIVKSIDFNAHAIVNGKSLLNITYTNKANGNITDAMLLIDGNVARESHMIMLDTAYAGKSYTKDFNVTFNKAGNQSVRVRLVYTDVTGERMQSDLGTFSVSVNNAVTSNTVVSSNKVFLWGGRILAAIAFVIAFYAGVVYFKKK